ncbi:hypothetical protein [Ideonella alba]|uniref:Ubiquinone biosynthesis protein UbiJ n=1 Tax=Ideonella alba TaxID=2824118 RepID=A0A940YA90_9BURK|nr:hypothetical protein [Ideonella alba]MBQ0931753.1 hypothetical protein [Ideonella alba]
MANPLTDLVLPAAAARFVLLANHVLTAAPVATDRLKVRQGRTLRVEVDGWRIPLPPPPPMTLRITPAGLLEAVAADEPGADQPDLRLRVDASQPLSAARSLASGQVPEVHVEGDAALAADITWILANVRWDIAADLERVVGGPLGDTVARAGEQVLAAARGLVQGVAGAVRKP